MPLKKEVIKEKIKIYFQKKEQEERETDQLMEGLLYTLLDIRESIEGGYENEK